MTHATCEAYGLHLDGTPTAGLPAASGSSTRVVVRQARQHSEPAGVGTERAVLDLPGGRQLVAQRDTGSATFTGPPLSDDELVHPYLGAAAAIFSRWAGREVFHAGAFVCGDLAWAVVGAREAGKSSLLATLAGRGWPVLADDLVVTDGHQVFCGPRTIDLRQRLPGSAEPVTPARGTTRWRLSLPPAPRAVPLGGWIYLRWDAEVTMRAVPASVVLARLAAGRTWPTLPSDPRTLLALAARPGWDLGRPADWGRMDEAVRVMLQTLPRSPDVRIQPGSRETRLRHTHPGNEPHPGQPARA
jgi:hypothetical protein